MITFGDLHPRIGEVGERGTDPASNPRLFLQ
jgi:hypothetical protein